MRHQKCLVTLVLAAAALPAFGQNTYTNLSMRGNYVFSESATALASAGVLSADGNGNVSGSLIQRMQGSAATLASVAGRYLVNPDGTATMALNLNAAAVVDSDSDSTPSQIIRQYDMVITSKGLIGAASGLGGLSAVEMEPQPAANTRTVSALKGVYGFQETGVVNSSMTQVSVGQFILDGTGGVRGAMQVRTTGSSPQSITFNGIYSVNPDGTGSITMLYSIPATTDDEAILTQSQFGFAIADGKLIGVRLDGGAYAISEFLRQ